MLKFAHGAACSSDFPPVAFSSLAGSPAGKNPAHKQPRAHESNHFSRLCPLWKLRRTHEEVSAKAAFTSHSHQLGESCPLEENLFSVSFSLNRTFSMWIFAIILSFADVVRYYHLVWVWNGNTSIWHNQVIFSFSTFPVPLSCLNDRQTSKLKNAWVSFSPFLLVIQKQRFPTAHCASLSLPSCIVLFAWQRNTKWKDVSINPGN